MPGLRCTRATARLGSSALPAPAVSGDWTALGAAVVQGPLRVGGAANFSGDVAVEGGAAVGGDLAVRGAAQVRGRLEVAGVARLLAGAQLGPAFELVPEAAGGLALRSVAGEWAVLEANATGRHIAVGRGSDTLLLAARNTTVAGPLRVEGPLTGVPVFALFCHSQCSTF